MHETGEKRVQSVDVSVLNELDTLKQLDERASDQLALQSSDL